MTIVMTAATGPCLQQRAILKITAPRVAHSYGMALEPNSSFLSEHNQEGIVDESSFIMDIIIIYSFYSSTGFYPSLQSSINYLFRQL